VAVLRGQFKKLILARISISCHLKKFFIVEHTCKIILPSLFEAKIQCNFLIMKLKLMQNLLANFEINSNEP